MSTPSIKLVFDRKGQATNIYAKDGKTGLVQLEVYFERKRKWITTGIKVYKNQWSPSLYVINHPQGPELNSQLNLMLNRAHKYIGDVRDGNSIFTFGGVEKAVSVRKFEFDTFLEAFDAYIDHIVSDGILKSSSVENYRNVRKKVVGYGGFVDASDLTLEKLEEFDRYMTDTGIMPTTKNEYHKRLSAVFNWLKRKKYVNDNPYDSFRFERVCRAETIRYLTEEECAKVEFHDFGDEQMNYVRDLFSFMRYTGMAFSDARKVTLDDIEIRDGKKVLSKKRKKTDVWFFIEVFEPAYQLLKKHGQFNKMSISYVDQKLNIIGYALFGKRLTTHMGRHSFGCWAIKHGVPVPYISKMLGHTNPETTLIYAEVIGSDVLEQSKKLEQAIAKNPVETAVVPMYG